MTDTIATRPVHQVDIEDQPYHKGPDDTLLARLYRPAGAGPFPTVIDLHGGAWTSGDRTQNVAIATALAESGILVVSLDFRMPPIRIYPKTLADINIGIRWAKKHAAEFGGRPDWVGGFGTSSGGHLILLAAMRPHDPRYQTIPAPHLKAIDARLAFVISGWGVLEPLLRYRLAKERGSQQFVKSHDAFWGSEEAMSDGSPPLMLERGEKVDLPPAMIFQGTDDEWVPQAMTKKFVASYRKAGGEMELELLPGAKHSFFRDDPTSPNALKAIALTKAFVLKRTVAAKSA
jgi:acetyl esterase